MNKPPPRVAFNFEPDPIEEEEPVIELNIEEEKKQNIIDTLDDMMPDIVEREEIIQENIFEAEEPEKPKPLPKPKPQPPKPVKLSKTGKPKRELSEEHLKKLEQNREKALQAKRIKAEENKKIKEMEAEEKELLKKKKQKDMDKLRAEVNDEKISSKPIPAPAPAPAYFTKEDLEKANFDAIQKYEVLRKARKAEKKQAEMIQKQQQDMISKINNYTYGARRPDGRLVNRFDSCY